MAAVKTSRKKAKSGPSPVRREVGAVIFLFLGIFSILGCFNVDALFINFFKWFFGGLIGWGFYSLPVMLFTASFILFFHRGRPVKFRVICAMVVPVTLGALIHLFAYQGELKMSIEIFGNLFTSGRDMLSGGLISGFLAFSFSAIFSRIGAVIIFIVLTLVPLLACFNMTVVSIVDAIRNRPRIDYEQKEEPADTAAILVNKAVEKRAAKKRAVIDIPVDDPPMYTEKRAEEKPTLFDKKPSVKTPDELLAEMTDEPLAEPPRVETDVSAVPELPVASVNQPPAPVIKDDKVKRGDAAQAAAEVAQEIENSVVDFSQYRFPPLTLLSRSNSSAPDGTEEMRVNAARLSETISSFNIEATIINVIRGPSVTRYELELDKGIKLAKLTGLADDIALSLGATGVRIAAIPDKISVVGIEVPNKLVSTVYIRDVIGSQEFHGSSSKVAFALGTDIGGNCIVGDIAKLPHLLIAGTTGSGKSVCMNSLIISLLYKSTPDEVRLIMIDPKMIELGIYNGIPHLLIPVVTDPKKAAGALQWAVTEMMRRYKLLADAGVRDVFAYNAAAEKSEDFQKLPQIVVVIDELADLMLVAAKEVEESICRIAQMARAAGMHLIIATQRPSADVITGIMKANIPSRIAFAVASQLESRIILDTTGAEKLVGKGDMLFQPLGAGKAKRVQGCFITSEEVEAVVSFIKDNSTSQYSEEIILEIEKQAEQNRSGSDTVQNGGKTEDGDELFPAAVEVILETGQASVSMLQRRLKLGYARAARIVDEMEERGIVGPFEGSKPRQLLITREMWQEMQMRGESMELPPNDTAFQELNIESAQESL